MAEHNYVVKVPKPDPRSYNPDRPINSLVQNQLFHLSVAEKHLAEEHRSGIDVYSIDTEAKAAKYIGHLTGKLHGGSEKRASGTEKSEAAGSRAETKGKNATSGKKNRR
jgi:hypothetical protein